MKKSLTALAALGACSAACHAETGVQLYGVLDAGILYKTGADAAGNRQTQLVSGGEVPNRWGLRGTEDLGNGWAATFRLESGFKIGSGTLINGGQAASAGTFLFDRGATVGLSSKRAGAFTFGRNWTPFWESLIGSDASGWSNFGSLNNLSYQTRTGLTGAGYYWANNSVKYQTPSYAGLRASVLYSFGGKAGDFQNSRLYSAALSYANGPIGLHAGYLDANDPTGASDRAVARAYNLGAVYHFAGASRAGVSWTHYANPVTGSSQDYAAVTGSWGVTAATVLTAACVHLTDRDDSQRNATLFKLGADHFLSKRTALYVDVGYVKNKSRGTLGLQNVVPAGRAGVNQFGLLTGVRTVF